MHDKKTQLFRPRAAASIVVANMVGTGVFTSLGYQLADIQSGFVLMMLWAIGGVIAFCGAMSYAELGASLPRSGGEYNFLGQIYHPAAGFVSGWISATVGFAGPTALAAITFASYLGAAIPGLPETTLAVVLVLVLTIVHATNRNASSNVQVAFTAVKIALIVLFCVLAFALVPEPQNVGFLPADGDFKLMTGGAFAVALIYVSYAYTGWNVATYLSAEIEAPQRNLPLVLGAGTIVVSLLYLALNYIFLYVAPIDQMVNKVEIGYIAAENAFGGIGARVMGAVLALLLISTVSAMIIAGPRVYQAIGQDHAMFAWLARTNRYGVPALAIYLQGALTITFILTSPFEFILLFSGFTLALNTLAAVLGLFVLRWRQPDLPRPFKAWGYPVTPLIFLVLTGWTLWFVLKNERGAGLTGLAVIAIGLVFYFITASFNARRDAKTDSETQTIVDDDR
ncbi:MAG: amino acid permease [Pseudomonadota bacterium]